MAGRQWSSQDDAALRHELSVGGDWRRRSAIKLGRTEDAVKIRIRKLMARGELDRDGVAQRSQRCERSRWTGANIVELKRLLARGWTARRIAEHLDCTRAAVLNEMRRLNISGARRVVRDGESIAVRPDAWSPHEIKALREMRREGMTRKQIGEELGRSVGTIQWKIKDLGLARECSWSDEETERLRYLRSIGVPYAEIARRLGRSVLAAQMRAKRIRRTSNQQAD